MPRVVDLLNDSANRLAAVSETPRLDAEILLAASLDISRAQLFARLRDECAPTGYQELLDRRMAFEPIAYILGTWEFFGEEIRCRAPVLVPRPETEHLVEAAIDHLKGKTASHAIDLCTGTGCVAIAIAKHAPGCRVTAVDIHPEAIALAKENVEMHRMGGRVRLLRGDLMEMMKERENGVGAEVFGGVDVVCANPPYVEEGEWPGLSPNITGYEDRGALVAGVDGLSCIRRLAECAADRLAPGGLIAFEMGDGQAAAVKEILVSDERYGDIRIAKDLAGIDRIATARRMG